MAAAMFKFSCRFLMVSPLCFRFKLSRIALSFHYNANLLSFGKQNVTRSLFQSRCVFSSHGNIAANNHDFVHPHDRMIFVGKLSPSTTKELVEEYFSQFGQVEEVHVKASKKRYELRSCAFVQFKRKSSLDKIFIDPGQKHVIDARRVTVEKYKACDSRKIQVSNVPVELGESQIREHFSQFGTVSGVQFVSNNPAVSRESYCFVEFASPSAVVKALVSPSQKIGDFCVDVKTSTAKNKNYIKGKVVIEMIPENMTVEVLRDYFSKFGHLTFIELIFYHSKGDRRDFAFLGFSDDKTVEMVAGKNGLHLVKNQEVHVKQASSNHVSKDRDLKIFVDRIPRAVSDYTVLRYFQLFGNATVTHKWRRRDNVLSCIVMFKVVAEVNRVLTHNTHYLGGEKLIVKRIGWTAKPHYTKLMEMLSVL